MERKMREADALCLTQLHELFKGVLPTFKTASGANSRLRIYTPLVTCWAFLAQVLDPDRCCRRAVTRVQPLCSALGLKMPKEDTGAYCVARFRLLEGGVGRDGGAEPARRRSLFKRPDTKRCNEISAANNPNTERCTEI